MSIFFGKEISTNIQKSKVGEHITASVPGVGGGGGGGTWGKDALLPQSHVVISNDSMLIKIDLIELQCLVVRILGI